MESILGQWTLGQWTDSIFFALEIAFALEIG